MGLILGKFYSCVTKNEVIAKKESKEQSTELTTIQQDLKNRQALFAEQLTQWKNIEKELTAIVTKNATLDDLAQIAPNIQVTTDHRNLLDKIMYNMRENLIPAENEIRELIQKSSDNIKKAEADLKINYIIATDKSKTEKEINLAKLKIARDCITSLENLIDLSTGINEEIDYCINFANLSENIIVELVKYIIFALIKIPLPDPEFSLTKPYQNFLADELKDEMKDDESLNSGIELELSVVMNIFNMKANTNVIAINPDNNFPTKLAQPAKNGMFGKNSPENSVIKMEEQKKLAHNSAPKHLKNKKIAKKA